MRVTVPGRRQTSADSPHGTSRWAPRFYDTNTAMPHTQPLSATFTPTFAHVPPGPVAGPLQLLPINATVMAVHTADGAHVGSLKLVGGVWKFKAMGYSAAGGMEPGHGPLTDQHNMQFAMPDAAEVSARLLGAVGSPP